MPKVTLEGESTTEQLERWIKAHGRARHALNAALVRLEALEIVAEAQQEEIVKLQEQIAALQEVVPSGAIE